ncbi:hypothetical protein BV898_18815 [Hypsibius exemplaris]|uniref:Uncharacterized protein n=1 Tax=Hypsibius exemplaris TaxID=2072580 RepID=A0A9X6RP72_HYPEX|nr:hypothetical protein BV898_18815 [Hypsibius exemplaris]
MFSDGVAFSRSTPRSLFGLYTVWFFMVTVVEAVVCYLLPSYLTVSTAQLPFTDLQSFQRSGYNLVGPPSAFKILNIMAGNKATEAFHTTVVNLICRRLRCECNITFTSYSWDASSSNGFHDYFQHLFGGDNPVDIGVSALMMMPERIRTVDFIFPPESNKYGIALYDNALVPIDQGAFFHALFARVSAVETFAVIAFIFLVIVVLIMCSKLVLTSNSASSHSSRLFAVANGMFELYAVAFGQDEINTNRSMSKSLYGFYSMWFCMVTIIGAIICSKLPSFLTVASQQLPFTDVRSFKDSGYTLFANSATREMLTKSADPDRQANAKTTEVLPYREIFGCANRERAVGERAAFFTNMKTCDSPKEKCQTSVLAAPNIDKAYVATFVTGKGSQHRNTFSRECNFAVEDLKWGLSTDDFHAFIQATFGDNTNNAIGIARIAITMDRMREIDFIYPSASYHYVIAVCEKDLPSAGDGTFFIALFAGVPVIATFAVIALTFVLLAWLITYSKVVIKQLSTSSSMSSGISALTHSRSTPRSLYGLYTVWFFIVTVVGAVVCSLLPSYLTVSTAQLPFTDLQSFQRSGYNLVGPPLAFKILNVRLYKHSAY